MKNSLPVLFEKSKVALQGIGVLCSIPSGARSALAGRRMYILEPGRPSCAQARYPWDILQRGFFTIELEGNIYDVILRCLLILNPTGDDEWAIADCHVISCIVSSVSTRDLTGFSSDAY
jgi:hypothetical protein